MCSPELLSQIFALPMRKFFLFIFTVFSSIAFGQNIDSLQFRFNKLGINSRVGTAFQKNFTYSVGLSLNKNYVSMKLDTNVRRVAVEDSFVLDTLIHPFIKGGYYSVYSEYEGLFDQEYSSLQSYKFGAEITQFSNRGSVAIGVEGIILNQKSESDFAIVPKFGYTYLYFTFQYGYRFYFENKYRYLLGSHQFGLSTSITPLLWKNAKKASRNGRLAWELLSK